MKTMLSRFVCDGAAASVLGGVLAAWVSVAVVGDLALGGELALVLA